MKLRKYQEEALSKLNLNGVNVLSICPGGGKTFTAIQYALNPEFKRVLILSHGTNVLKHQWSDELKSLGIEFSNDIDGNSKFVVGIPHAFKNKKIPKFDLVIVDEAHEFYFADKMVKEIIQKASPRAQLLLTGTPSRLIANGLTPVIISGVDVYREGYLADPYIACVASKYALDEAQFDLRNEVKGSVKETKALVEASFSNLLKEMLNRLTSSGFMKESPNLNSVKNLAGLKKVANLMFNKLDKTMISSRDVKQAKMIHKILEQYEIKSVISVHTDDKDSSEIKKFKEDGNVKVLIVVRRGILGFNMPELVNVIDFTGSRNIDRIYQLYARVLRKNGDSKKFFFKLGYGVNNDIDAIFLQAALCLNNGDFISKYNGKNLNGMEILEPQSKRKNGDRGESLPSKKNKAVGIDSNMLYEVMRLELMQDMTINSQNPYWSEYKYTKFGNVIEKLTGKNFFRKVKKKITREQLLEVIKTGIIPESIYE